MVRGKGEIGSKGWACREGAAGGGEGHEGAMV